MADGGVSSINYGESLLQLSALLGSGDNDNDGGQDARGTATMTPGCIGPPKSTTTVEPRAQQKKPALKANLQDIWSEEEVPVDDRGAHEDHRPVPDYDILYKQAVTSEDMYLQMSGRDPSTHQCDDMVVRIKLPGHKLSYCELDVNDTYLDLRSTKYRLGLHLPHPCDSKNGSAKFDSKKCELIVTLRMTREMDFLKQ
eukprot:m.39295 g.39295  ORF g.39295 m.39295 type:complete len:198 (-) comp9531_c0_seq1:22-615(-)